MTQSITIVNRSTVLTNSQVQAAILPLQTQVSRDFAPIWGVDATLEQAPAPSPHAWPLYLVDDATVQGALGFHEDPRGAPDSIVFVKTTLDAGLSWTVTVSHELLEMLADPTTRRTRSHFPYRYALEVGDPVEDDRYAYTVGGIQVSDFITPAWFGTQKPGALYDFANRCTGPRQILIGGYQLRYDVLHGWRQLVAQNGTVQARKMRLLSDIVSRPGTSGRTARRLKH